MTAFGKVVTSTEAPGVVEYSRWWQRRCTARVEPNSTGYHGRCDCRRGHHGDHALERGFYVFRWSTSWSRIDPGPGTVAKVPGDPPTPYPPPPA